MWRYTKGFTHCVFISISDAYLCTMQRLLLINFIMVDDLLVFVQYLNRAVPVHLDYNITKIDLLQHWKNYLKIHLYTYITVFDITLYMVFNPEPHMLADNFKAKSYHLTHSVNTLIVGWVLCYFLLLRNVIFWFKIK